MTGVMLVKLIKILVRQISNFGTRGGGSDKGNVGNVGKVSNISAVGDSSDRGNVGKVDKNFNW